MRSRARRHVHRHGIRRRQLRRRRRPHARGVRRHGTRRASRSSSTRQRRQLHRNHHHQRQRCLFADFGRLRPSSMLVRVVNGTVRSARTGGAACTTCVPVQTFRTDASSGTAVAVTNRVGGENAGLERRGRESRHVAYWRRSRRVAACRSPSPPPRRRRTAIDDQRHRFRFQFRHRGEHARLRRPARATNSSYPCQGSLRQFVINSNALGGEGSLSQSGSGQIDGATSFLPSGFESSIFMIPDGRRGQHRCNQLRRRCGDHAGRRADCGLGRQHAPRCDDADRQHRQRPTPARWEPAAPWASTHLPADVSSAPRCSSPPATPSWYAQRQQQRRPRAWRCARAIYC